MVENNVVAKGQPAVVWQSFLDEKFPHGMQMNYVRSDGSLQFPPRVLPVVTVMDMDDQNTWPILTGFDFLNQLTYDVWLLPVSWVAEDRDGRYVARIRQFDGPDVELSSWISEELAQAMAPVRSDLEREGIARSNVLADYEPVPGAVPAVLGGN